MSILAHTVPVLRRVSLAPVGWQAASHGRHGNGDLAKPLGRKTLTSVHVALTAVQRSLPV
jgi:hypothetical protein